MSEAIPQIFQFNSGDNKTWVMALCPTSAHKCLQDELDEEGPMENFIITALALEQLHKYSIFDEETRQPHMSFKQKYDEVITAKENLPYLVASTLFF